MLSWTEDCERERHHLCTRLGDGVSKAQSLGRDKRPERKVRAHISTEAWGLLSSTRRTPPGSTILFRSNPRQRATRSFFLWAHALSRPTPHPSLSHPAPLLTFGFLFGQLSCSLHFEAGLINKAVTWANAGNK